MSDLERADAREVWWPALSNAGFFFLLVGIFGTAVLRKDVDPLGRLLLWLVAFILVLLLFTAPGMFFTRPQPPPP